MIHFRPEANKYTEEELLLLKNKDMGYILQSIQSEKKVCDDVKVFRSNKYSCVLYLNVVLCFNLDGFTM